MNIKTIKPVSPEDVHVIQKKSFPKEVFEVFNEQIAGNFSGDTARIIQKDVINELIEKGFSSTEIFAKGWLNIEEAYRAEGWEVSYDKPGYNESYNASFTFKAKK